MATQAMNPCRYITMLIVLGLAGCSDTERFSFEGAADDFCVPTDYVIHGPIWLTGAVADDGGLAFQGCGLSFDGPCDMPEIVSVGTLGPIEQMRGRKWGDFYPQTEPRETTLAALRNRTYRLIPDDFRPGYRMLAVHSRLMGATGVYYWQIPADGDPRLEPSSELLAECAGVNDKRSPVAAEVAYGCSRTIPIADAGLHYNFSNGAVSTAFVSDLDARVIAGIDKWRCKKATSPLPRKT